MAARVAVAVSLGGAERACNLVNAMRESGSRQVYIVVCLRGLGVFEILSLHGIGVQGLNEPGWSFGFLARLVPHPFKVEVRENSTFNKLIR